MKEEKEVCDKLRNETYGLSKEVKELKAQQVEVIGLQDEIKKLKRNQIKV